MTDIELLNQVIKESGMTLTFIANKSEMSRQTLYNRLAGKGEFTIAEMRAITKTLGLPTRMRDRIFLS